MRAKTGLVALFVGACTLSMGCRTTLEASLWLPDFSSLQASGVGGDVVDLHNQLGVVPDERVFVFDLIGDAGRNRVRIDSWSIHGEGTTGIHGGFLFSGVSYPALDNVETKMDLEALGILWEPAVIKTDGFRLRVAVGLDFLKFKMTVDDLDDALLSGTVEMPDPDGPLGDLGMDYMPVPKVGLAFEADLGEWVRIHGRAQMFDASYLELDDRFDGTFLNAVFGVGLGKHSGIRGFLGYRIFNAEYQFDDDSGDSSLEGFIVSVSARF